MTVRNINQMHWAVALAGQEQFFAINHVHRLAADGNDWVRATYGSIPLTHQTS
jgi:hypothetical protein